MSHPTDPAPGGATPAASEPPPGQPAWAGGTFVALLAIAAATALAYSSSLGGSFQFDDGSSIVENRMVRDLGGFWPPSGNRWLGFLSFAVNYRLGGLDPFGYHLANLLIHVANGLLVHRLTALTLRTPVLRGARAGPLVRPYLPLAAGLLFALHPVQTQAVTYVAQRFTSLATLFYLLSLALYAQGRLSLDDGSASKVRAACLYGLSVAAAAAAMETKQISFTLPFVAAGYEVLFFGAGRRLLLLAPVGATALLVPLGMAGHGQGLGDVLGDVSRFAAETRDIPRSVYLLTETRVVVTYIRLLFLPVGQNLDWDFPLSHSLLEPSVLFAIAILSAVIALGVFLLVRSRRTGGVEGVIVFSGIAWFFATLSVESSVVPIRDVIFEHRLYLPSVGAMVATGTGLLWAVQRVRSRVRPGLRVAAALLATAGPLGAATYARNRVWKDEITMWSDVVAKSPGKARPHCNLGVAYGATGRLEGATRELREAVRLDPGYAKAHFSLALAHGAKGETDAAMREYRETIRLAPWYAEAHNNLGNAYLAAGALDGAAREYREAIRLDPGYAVAHNNLGIVHRWKGELGDAMREYREAIRLDPRYAQAHNNLGIVHEATGELDAAMREYREAIRLDPGHSRARYNLGAVLKRLGRPAEAVEEIRRASPDGSSR